MRKTIVMAAVAACMFVSNVFAQRIKGSDTCLPLSQTEAENFINKNKSAKITVTGGGSGVGISALMEGTTDIAMSSRKMKFDEKVKLQEAKKSTKEVVIAYDALAVVVHPSNKVSNLTREQLEGIFTGKIKNWKEVGGADMKIVAYSRETSSGTYEFFKESVLKNKNYMNGILSMPATGAIIQSVSQTKGAIGYVGFGFIKKKEKKYKKNPPNCLPASNTPYRKSPKWWDLTIRLHSVNVLPSNTELHLHNTEFQLKAGHSVLPDN